MYVGISFRHACILFGKKKPTTEKQTNIRLCAGHKPQTDPRNSSDFAFVVDFAQFLFKLLNGTEQMCRPIWVNATDAVTRRDFLGC